jgi:hypothetical protein
VADLDGLNLLLVTHAAYDQPVDTEKILCRFPDLHLIYGADVHAYLMHRGFGGKWQGFYFGMCGNATGKKR